MMPKPEPLVVLTCPKCGSKAYYFVEPSALYCHGDGPEHGAVKCVVIGTFTPRR